MYSSKSGPTFPIVTGEWEPTAELRTNTVKYISTKKRWFGVPSPYWKTFFQQLWRRDVDGGFEAEWRAIPHVETERIL